MRQLNEITYCIVPPSFTSQYIFKIFFFQMMYITHHDYLSFASCMNVKNAKRYLNNCLQRIKSQICPILLNRCIWFLQLHEWRCKHCRLLKYTITWLLSISFWFELRKNFYDTPFDVIYNIQLVIFLCCCICCWWCWLMNIVLILQ